jgi:hypothetical protein
MDTAKTVLSTVLSLASALFIPASLALPSPSQQAQESGQSAVTRRIGAIKAIEGNTITLTPGSSSDVRVTVSATTKIVRIAPGEKSLKNAAPIQLPDLQVGDRILVGGKASEDAKSLVAASIVVMKRSDLEARSEQNLLDWQKRGVDGLVRTVDLLAGSITITVPGFGVGKEVTVQTSKDTVIRRYAPNSANFSDAKTGTLEEIRSGDQLHARGTRSVDGSMFTAEELVTGSFRNIEGTVNSVDASVGMISVQDLLSKKTVQVKVTADSQLRRLPEEVARFALQGNGGAGGSVATSSAPGAAAGAAASERGTATAAGGGNGQQDGMRGGIRSGHAPDLNRMLGRMPALTLADLHKGDAVLIVATDGVPPSGGSVTKLLSGVESILRAPPSASQILMLTPWNLGGSSDDSGNQ